MCLILIKEGKVIPVTKHHDMKVYEVVSWLINSIGYIVYSHGWMILDDGTEYDMEGSCCDLFKSTSLASAWRKFLIAMKNLNQGIQFMTCWDITPHSLIWSYISEDSNFNMYYCKSVRSHSGHLVSELRI